MDLKVFTATFGVIFFTELADKTQLVGIGMSAKSGRPLIVLFASILTYMLVITVSVFIGTTLGKYIKPEIIRYCGALLFIVIGILILLGKV